MATQRRLAANLVSGVMLNVFRIGLQVVLLPLMARLVGPDEIGLYGLAAPMMTFVSLISDAGLGDSLAREKSSGTLVWSSAFWGLLVFAGALSVAVYASSFVVAWGTDQPRLPGIMLPLALTLFLTGFVIIPIARLLREGNLLPATIGEFIAQASGAAVGLTLAFMHFGVWAMVWQYLTAGIVRAGWLNIVRPVLPRLEFSLKSLHEHFHVGGAMLGARLIDLGGRQGEGSWVTRNLGAAQNGFFGLANQIGRFFSDSLGNPIWANAFYITINRSEEEANAHFIKSTRLFALIIFPAATFLALAMPTLVPILLGSKWIAATYPIMALLLSSPFPVFANIGGAVLYARRLVKVMWASAGVYAVARLLVVIFSVSHGVVGIALALSAINMIYFVYFLLVICPSIGVKARELIVAMAGPLLAAAVAGAAFYFLQRIHPGLIWLTASGALTVLLYPASLFLFDRRRLSADIAGAMALLKSRGESPEPAGH